MTDDVRISIAEVELAIERLNDAFDKWVQDLRTSGDQEALERAFKQTAAIKDSGGIYLSWARHYAGMEETPLMD